ncbi:MAG: hypothetical protein AAGK71_13125 [Pseudomonadota bacterium]
MDYATFSATIGLLGVALYLGSYAALQTGWLRADQEAYALLNIAAAACVLLELQRNYNLPSVLIQVSWILISIVGLLRIRTRKRRARPIVPEWLPNRHLERSLFRMEVVRGDALGSNHSQMYRHAARGI